MFFLICMSLVELCFANDSTERINNLTTAGNVTFELIDNPYIALSETDDGKPDSIEYLQTITPDTELMVRVFYVDDDGSSDDSEEDDDLLNLCELLDNALFKPESSEAQHNMASHFGMNGSLCPIVPGVKELTELPVNVTTKDFGCVTAYRMRVMAGNNASEADAIMKIRVPLNAADKNETCIENSSSNLAMPSIVFSIVVGLFTIESNY